MSHYQHLTIEDREKILLLHAASNNLHNIAKEINRNVSTVSRELKGNTSPQKVYSATTAQQKYQKRRKECGRRKLLENTELKSLIHRLFLAQQWSPEQISCRLAYENSPHRISYNTIYRAIYAGIFDTTAQRCSHGNRGATRKLRRRGKTRRKRGTTETRGKIVISNKIHERPVEADSRKVIGHWEADTMVGKRDSACLVTVTDRCSRYLMAEKICKKVLSRSPIK